MIKLIPKLAKRLTKEQRDVLKKSVKEKREIPTRVVYTQKYWDKIANDFSYSLASRELTALKRSIANISKILSDKKINVIHLGVGNGVEITFLINALNIKNIDTYSIVDVNKTMLDISEAKIKKQYPVLKIKRFCKDIETYGIREICKETKKDGADVNLIVLIANGVLFSNDELVRDMVKNMNNHDFFLLSLELYQKGKDREIIKPYLIPSVLDLLANGVKILGYKIEYEYFDAEIDKKKYWLKVYFNPNGDKTKRLLVLHSYKPNAKQLTQRMNKFGLDTLQINEHRNIHTCLALFKRK
jgi:hypothetical protein